MMTVAHSHRQALGVCGVVTWLCQTLSLRRLWPIGEPQPRGRVRRRSAACGRLQQPLPLHPQVESSMMCLCLALAVSE